MFIISRGDHRNRYKINIEENTKKSIENLLKLYRFGKIDIILYYSILIE